jgi:hypothetical protein
MRGYLPVPSEEEQIAALLMTIHGPYPGRDAAIEKLGEIGTLAAIKALNSLLRDTSGARKMAGESQLGEWTVADAANRELERLARIVGVSAKELELIAWMSNRPRAENPLLEEVLKKLKQ